MKITLVEPAPAPVISAPVTIEAELTTLAAAASSVLKRIQREALKDPARHTDLSRLEIIFGDFLIALSART
jgi:hypothetical protein